MLFSCDLSLVSALFLHLHLINCIYITWVLTLISVFHSCHGCLLASRLFSVICESSFCLAHAPPCHGPQASVYNLMVNQLSSAYGPLIWPQAL